jgi:pimeloyl-ACP methyl ester carboxylesterase
MNRSTIAFFAAAVLLGAGAPSIENVGGTRASIVLPDASPSGSIVLIPGGTTLQKIPADGSAGNSGNFVMRIRSDLVSAGFAVAFVEDPTDLRAIIARMRAVKRPVFLLSTSNGTRVAAVNAAALGADGPDGIVLTSTVTQPSRRYPASAASANVQKITVPVLFVHNTNDGCAVSPPNALAALIARFPKGSDVTRIDVTSTMAESGPCDPFAPHGYMGIESDVTAKILAWMRAHGAVR